MNFKEWYREFLEANGYHSSDFEYVAESSWDACRKEVLNILKDNIREYQSAHGTGWEYVDIEVIKEIEKL